MTANIISPYPYFTDTTGAALDAGSIYIGVAGADPRTSPVTVYQDEAETIPWAQPVRTVLGYPSYQGAPSRIFSPIQSYSILVLDSRGRVVFRNLSTSALTFATTRTPYDFGAYGNGIADDTAAVQAALNSAVKHVYFPPGLFRITGTVTSAVDDRTIDGPGALTATTAVAIAMTVTGDRNEVAVNIAGNEFIGVGIRFEGAELPIVSGGRIRDLKSTTANCAGLFFSDTQAGFIVRGVTITDVDSPGNGTLGDNNGFSRAIAIGLSGDPTGNSVIEGCYIANIIGEEGDAIAGVSGGGGTYYRLDLTVKGNTIRGFTRRAIKTQGSNVRVIGNSISNDWTVDTQVPNRASVIDFVQGGDCIARDNDLYGCDFFNQVSVQAQDAEVWNNFLIDGNTFWGLSAANTDAAVSITQSGPSSPTSATGLIVRGNAFSGSSGRAISIGKCTAPVVSGNVMSMITSASTRTISYNSAVTKAVTTGNVMIGGVRQSFIADDGFNSVVSDNHVKTDTPLFSNASGNGNHLAANNSIDGTGAFYFNISTTVGNRLGDNYNFGDQINTAPGTLFTATASGPTVALSGLQVRVGQVVIDSTPTAGGKIGWTATTSGVSAVAWAPTTAYLVGAYVTNGGNGYICTTSGTSAGAGGPTGTSLTIPVTDGTAAWLYVSPAVTWKQFGAIDA